MLPARFQPVVFGFILSGVMSLLVSGISTFRAAGMAPEFLSIWLGNWAVSWAVAFPTLLVFAPRVRRLVARFVSPE